MADATGLQPAPGPNADIKEEEIDASIEENIDPNPQPEAMIVDNTNEAEATIAPANFEPRIPAKKDATLREFLSKMDDYAPIIPDAVTNYYLSIAGLPPPPQTSPHLARLLALATQKFIADIATDAYQYSRIRSGNNASNNTTGLAPGMPGVAGGPAAGAAAAAKEGSKGAALGVQRPGFGGGGQGGAGQGRTVLTMEDLGMAAGEYGVNIKRSEFYR